MSYGTTDEAQIARLEHESHDAMLNGDVEALDRLLADEFVFTDAEGRRVTKADWMAEVAAGTLTFESISLDDLEVRVYGDAAVTFGRVTMKGHSKGEGRFRSRYCFTATWVKRNGRWQTVADHATLLKTLSKESMA